MKAEATVIAMACPGREHETTESCELLTLMDQSTTAKQQPRPQEPPRKRSRGRDAVVLITVPLVAIAVTLAVFVQLSLPIPVSMAIGGLVGGLLIALHALHHRGQTISALREEVARLNALRNASNGGPVRTARPEIPARGPGSPSERSQKSVGAEPRQAEIASAIDATGLPGAEPSPAQVVQPKIADPRPLQNSLPPPLPVTAPAVTDKTGSATMAGAPPLPPPANPQVSTAASTKPAVSSEPKPSGITPGAGDAPAGKVMAPYWDLRPGAVREPALASGQEDLDFLRNTTTPAMTVKPLPARPAKTSEVDVDTARPSAQELDVMHTLIEQLAIQLNEPKSGPAAALVMPGPSGASHKGSSDPAAAKVEESIEASLSALKVTAETMRKPPALAQPATGDAREPAPAVAEARSLRKPADSSSYSRLAELTEAVAADRIEVYLDPIHGLDDRKAKHFEVAVRLRSAEGDSLSADDYMRVALGTGLLAKIDQAKLTRTARVADRLQARNTEASLFSNIAGESLTDDGFLDTFEAVLGQQETLPARLVLSFAQSDVRAFTDVHLDAILTMSEIGVRFALESVTDLDMDFAELKAHGFEYVKLDTSVFLEGLPASDGPIPAPDICRHLAQEGLALIIGHIEDELTLAKILGFGVVFGQGALFGGARPVKIEMAPAPNVVAA